MRNWNTAEVVADPDEPELVRRRPIEVDDHVRLRVELSDAMCSRGDLGVVCSKWNMPAEVCEVEFVKEFTGESFRVLVDARHLDLVVMTSTPG
jgi:hypothetical protein